MEIFWKKNWASKNLNSGIDFVPWPVWWEWFKFDNSSPHCHLSSVTVPTQALHPKTNMQKGDYRVITTAKLMEKMDILYIINSQITTRLLAWMKNDPNQKNLLDIGILISKKQLQCYNWQLAMGKGSFWII